MLSESTESLPGCFVSYYSASNADYIIVNDIVYLYCPICPDVPRCVVWCSCCLSLWRVYSYWVLVLIRPNLSSRCARSIEGCISQYDFQRPHARDEKFQKLVQYF